MGKQLTYNGVTYTVDDNLSKEQGIEVIKDFLAKKEKKGKAEKGEAEYEGLGWEIGEGVVSGLIGIGQGVGETVGLGVDLMFDTDVSSAATRTGENIRNLGWVNRALGTDWKIDPAGFAGKGTELVTQFAVPGGLAVSAISKGSKIAKGIKSLPKWLKEGTQTAKKVATGNATIGQKAALGAQKIAAVGAADAVVATDGITILPDFFETGYLPEELQTDKTTGLTGRDEALRRLGNKLKIGAEGAVAQAVLPPLIGKAAGLAGAAALKTGAPQTIAKGANVVLNKVNDGLKSIETKRVLGEYKEPFISSIKDIIPRSIDNVASVLRYRGYLPQEVAEIRALIAGTTQAEIKGAQTTLGNLDKAINKAVKTQQAVGGTKLLKTQYYNTIEEILTATSQKARERLYQNLPDSIVPEVKNMRNQIDELSNSILKSDYVKNLNAINPKTGKELTATIKKNLGSYLRRRYNIFEKSNYKPSDEVLTTAKAEFKKDKKAVIKELNEVVKTDPNKTFKDFGLADDGKDFLDPLAKITDEQAELAVQSFLSRYKPRHNISNAGGKTPIDYLNPKMFLERTHFKDYQKALLGEVKDPREAFLSTIADLSEFKAVDNYFSKIRELSESTNLPKNSLIKKLFVNTKNLSPENIQALKQGRLKGHEGTNYKILEGGDELGQSKWGSIEGLAVPETIYNQLTRNVSGDENAWVAGAKSVYGTFLRGKGITQYGKTVLSPITQVRNVTTAAAFAAMQGNIGRNASLGESVALVFNDIRRGWMGLPGKAQLKQLQELQELGVISTQAELKEIQALISQGMVKETGPKIVNGVKLGRDFGNAWTDNSLIKFFADKGKVAQDLYQGGDNIWKIYNYTFEMNKLKNALRNTSNADKIAHFNPNIARQVDDFIKNNNITGNRNLSAREIAFDQLKIGRNDSVVEKLIKEEAARTVRNNVPNYNLVPTAIKELRKLPLGNFIAFPAEIIRTSMNTVTKGLDELASPIKGIQEIGLRRLSGALGTSVIVPPVLSSMAYSLSGIPKEVMDAYKRSGAPPWERNARLIPTGRDEDGKITYVNYSYSNPYDMNTRWIISALNKAQEGKELGLSNSKIVTNAVKESLGELFRPFSDESIIYAKIRDVLDSETPFAGGLIGGRNGKTITGAEVYNEQDDGFTQVRKSLYHIVDGLLPTLIPADVRKGEWEPSRFARGVINSLNLNDALGVSKIDAMNRERKITEELGRAFTGITEQSIDLPVSIGYRGYEFQSANRKASGIFNSIATKPNVTAKELKYAFEKASAAKYRLANQFRQTVEDYKIMGLDEGEIYTALKENNVSGIDNIVFGDTFIPFEISKPILEEMARNDTIHLLPWDDMNAVYDKYIEKGYNADELDNEVSDEGGGDSKNIFQRIMSAFIPEAGAEEMTVNTLPEPAVNAPLPKPAVNAPASPALNIQPPAPAPLNIQSPSPASSAGNINPLLVPDPVTRATFGSQ